MRYSRCNVIQGNIGLKGYTVDNWDKRWDVIEEAVNLALGDRFENHLPQEFKLERRELATYLERVALSKGYHSFKDLADALQLGKIENSVVVLNHKIILMDHNPGAEGYASRYLGEGKFGRAKLGMDRLGNAYTIKNERRKADLISNHEQAIMKKAGIFQGVIYRETHTQKPWIDKDAIHEKMLSVMSYVPGEPINKYLDRRESLYKRFTELEKKVISLAILKMVDEINQKGIAHRDHNLNNIMFDINQLPPNLDEIDLSEYIQGKNPHYNFMKMVGLVDWGLAYEIPIDGSEISINRPFSYYHTAPEYYAHKLCSRHSETFTIAKMLIEDLGMNFDLLREVCPNSVYSKLYALESVTNRRLDALKRANHASDPNERQTLITLHDNLTEDQKNLTDQLRALLLIFPPTDRPTIAQLCHFLTTSILDYNYSKGLVLTVDHPTIRFIEDKYDDDPNPSSIPTPSIALEDAGYDDEPDKGRIAPVIMSRVTQDERGDSVDIAPELFEPSTSSSPSKNNGPR